MRIAASDLADDLPTKLGEVAARLLKLQGPARNASATRALTDLRQILIYRVHRGQRERGLGYWGEVGF